MLKDDSRRGFKIWDCRLLKMVELQQYRYYRATVMSQGVAHDIYIETKGYPKAWAYWMAKNSTFKAHRLEDTVAYYKHQSYFSDIRTINKRLFMTWMKQHAPASRTQGTRYKKEGRDGKTSGPGKLRGVSKREMRKNQKSKAAEKHSGRRTDHYTN